MRRSRLAGITYRIDEMSKFYGPVVQRGTSCLILTKPCSNGMPEKLVFAALKNTSDHRTESMAKKESSIFPQLVAIPGTNR